MDDAVEEVGGQIGQSQCQFFRVVRLNPQKQSHLAPLHIPKLDDLNLAVARHDLLRRGEDDDGPFASVCLASSVPETELWSMPEFSLDERAIVTEWECMQTLNFETSIGSDPGLKKTHSKTY